MNPASLKRGATVAVRGFQGVACWYLGPEEIPGEHYTRCWECNGRGTQNPALIRPVGPCLCCDGTGEVYDEEPSEVPTGRALVCMVGDDHKHTINYEDLSPLDEGDFCGECGSIGCGHGRS